MVNEKYPQYVTTDADLWNSADESYFFLVKKEAKETPELITPIFEYAFEQGLIREATDEEIKEYKFKQEVEQAVQKGFINPGMTYNDTIANYNDYIEKKKSFDNKKEEPKKEEVKVEKSTSKTSPMEEPKIEPKQDSKPTTKTTKSPQEQKPSVSTKSF